MPHNPLLQPWTAAFGLPPFAALEPEHFEPALAAAMLQHREELQVIASATAPPDFDNTVAAFDRSGRLLERVASVFHNLCSSVTNPALQAAERALAAPLAAHRSAVFMNAALFARVDAVHQRRHAMGLTPEAVRLVERVHLDFVRAGAQLPPAEQARYAAVMQELASLTTRFGQNVLNTESNWVLPLQDEAALAGLPAFVRAAARQAAVERGLGATTGHVVTLSRSLVVPFLTYSERRDLREQAWRAWVGRGETAPEHDNRALVLQILRLRAEQARLHGRASYADYALVDTMAGSRAAVHSLLDEVWPRARLALERERALLEARMKAGAADHLLQAWDWRFYAELVRREHYALDDAEIKPYFRLEAVAQAAFDCAGRLFGLSFEPRADIPVYHPDVKAYEVRDAGGHTVGLFLQDNFARPGKRSGAWMSALRWQSRNTGCPDAADLPVILNNNNFARGDAATGAPTLLSLDDARTLFHEFGHGLHGLLSSVTYRRLSGTQVLRDFVELPSQLFEHWLTVPEVLQRHARHWRTGEPMPADLLARMRRAQCFNQGYETMRYTASALVDLAIHSLGAEELPVDVCEWESAFLREAGLPEAVGQNHRLVHFQHLFAGSSYAAGYYVYLWAEVLDADGFDAFTEAGSAFDPNVAQRLREHIYASGNSVEPRAAYQAFRGRAATVQPLLEKRGLIQAGDAVEV